MVKGPKMDPWGTPTCFMVKSPWYSVDQSINWMFIQLISQSIECSCSLAMIWDAQKGYKCLTHLISCYRQPGVPKLVSDLLSTGNWKAEQGHTLNYWLQFLPLLTKKVSFLRTNPYGMLYMISDYNSMGNSLKLFSIQKNAPRKLSI